MTIWPRGLIGRVTLVLLGAMLLEFIGSTILFQKAELASADISRAEHIAGQLSIAARMLSATGLSQRSGVARLLSSDDLTLEWPDTTMLLPNHLPVMVETRATSAMRKRLLEAQPDLEPQGLLLGRADHRDLAGVLRLADGSLLRFTAADLLPVLPAFYNQVLSDLIVAACVLAAAAMVVRTLGAPLRVLAMAADAIGHGPAVAVAISGPTEVRRVAGAFNAMQLRISTLIEERTRALVAVSHDLRTPVARLRLRCGLLSDTEAQSAIGGDLDEMQAMIESVLAYMGGREQHEARRRVDLPAMLATLVDDATDAGHDAHYEGPEHALVEVRPVAFKRALSNLIGNALTYAGQVRVRLLLDNDAMRVQVDDDGPGIPEYELERVMQPFHRLESSRNRGTGGVGLGLTIVQQSVLAEGGTIILRNRDGGGLRAEITLPVINAAD